MTENEKLFQQYRNLPQYKNKTDEEINALVAAKIEEDSKTEDELDIESMFADKGEKKEARKLIKKYLNTFTFETISEMNMVKQLVFLEIFNIRLQNELNIYHKDGQPTPPKLVESLHTNLAQISTIKGQLGIRKDKDKGQQSDAYLALETLKRKFEKWREENQGSRHMSCPHCGKMVMWKIRTDAWEAQKHPFFKDRFLCNKHLLKLCNEGYITTHDVALILETSDDYILWLLEKTIPKKKEEKRESQQEKSNGMVSQVQPGQEPVVPGTTNKE